MPSNARKRFDESATDIDNLIDTYRAMVALWEEDKEPVPEGFEVLFRSAVVLMVSHWEAYVEDICHEALEHLVLYTREASKLPKEIKKQVASAVKGAENEIEVWKLADNGWKDYLKERMAGLKEARDRSFNSPKAQQTSDFVKKSLGIEDIQNSWRFDDIEPKVVARKLDTLIEIRGEIAHRGRVKQKLDQYFVSEHISFLRKLVSKTGDRINSHLKKATGKSLW